MKKTGINIFLKFKLLLTDMNIIKTKKKKFSDHLLKKYKLPVNAN